MYNITVQNNNIKNMNHKIGKHHCVYYLPTYNNGWGEGAFFGGSDADIANTCLLSNTLIGFRMPFRSIQALATGLEN